MEKFLAGSLEKFDFVFSYSSVEHTGLGKRQITFEKSALNDNTGRYGDSLNPWGDMMAVAEAWCVSTPEAMMAIGVPVTMGEEGELAFNAHRIYSAKNYPYLVRNKPII